MIATINDNKDITENNYKMNSEEHYIMLNELKKLIDRESNIYLNKIEYMEKSLSQVSFNKSLKTYKQVEELLKTINLAKLLNVKEKEKFVCPFFIRKVTNKSETIFFDDIEEENERDKLERIRELIIEAEESKEEREDVYDVVVTTKLISIKYVTEMRYSNYICNNKYYINTVINELTTLNYKYKPSLSLIDLIQIIYNINYLEAVEVLCEMTNIIILDKDFKYRRKQKIKYANNIIKINNLTAYPALQNLIGKYTFIIKMLQEQGLKNLYTLNKSYQTHNIFTYSVRQCRDNLEEFVKNITDDEQAKVISTGSISSIFRLLMALGLLNKIDIEYIDKNYKYNKQNKTNNEIDYFYIQEYTVQIFRKAEKIAKKLLKAKICATNFTYNNVKEILDDKVIEEIFKNTIRKNKNKDNRNILPQGIEIGF